jgi:RnfABCDGE-type electron transport complex D subunit
MAQLVYSSSPHVKAKNTTRRIMIDVCIALAPACIVGCVYFGLGAILNFAVAIVACLLSEFLYRLAQKVPAKQIVQEFDFTSLVTALLIAMNMYANTPWYVTLLASVFAIVVTKMLFGGTGNNVVNPAIAGRVFATISFGFALGGTMNSMPGIEAVAGGVVKTAGATPLGVLLGTAEGTLSTVDLLLGTGVAGTIGETCAAALLLGGIYLVVRNVLNFRWPLVYMVAVGVVSFVMNYFTNEAWDVTVIWNSILTGGVVLGGVFMATDYVTSPNTKLGNYIYFAFLGLLTAVLRFACKTEVVSYVILLGNLIVPLINKFTARKPFGYQKPQKEDK